MRHFLNRAVPRMGWSRSRPRFARPGMSIVKGSGWEPGNVSHRFLSPLVFCRAGIVASRAPLDVNGLAANGRADLRAVGLGESLSRVATLAAAALSAPSASIMSADARALPGISGAPGIGDQRSPFEQLLCAEVVGSQDKVIIGDTRLGRRRGNTDLSGPASVIAWAGVPVRDQDGHVAGVLWVADWKPRSWSTSDIAILEILAEVA